MIDQHQLKWIASDEDNVNQFRQTSWNGITISIEATDLDQCKAFASGGGDSRIKEDIAPCDAVKWVLEQAEDIYNIYVERLQKDKVATIEAVDKCITP